LRLEEKGLIMTEETQEKMIEAAEIVDDGVPFGVVSFEELEAVKQSEAAGQMARSLSHQFQMMIGNIFQRDDIEDKAGAIKSLANEFAQRVDDAMDQKELDEKAVWSTKFVNDLPDSSFLHILPGGERNGEGKTKPRSLRMFPYKDKSGKVDLPHLRNAIARIPQSNRIDAATKERLQTKARGILKKQSKEKEDDGVIAWLKEKLGWQEPEPEPPKQEPFSVWKETNGSMRWMAVYSNNYRDDDNPPEIISKDAHLDFVRAVDAGEWPMPELWHWHVKGSRYGVATIIAYDEDTGMSLAVGTIDKGMESIAEAIFARQPLVSHGMPTPEIRRDETDPTIMTRYRTKEISTLPDVAAANKITFYDLKEQENMNIPEKKLEELEAVGFDVDALTAKLTAAQQKAEDEERESKEVETEEKDETEVVETQPEATEPLAPSFDYDALAGAIGAALDERLEPLQQRIAALEVDDSEEEKEIDLTPAASVAGLIRSAVLGQAAARVDGRSKEAKDAPAEHKETTKANPLFNSGNLLADTVVNDSRIAN
jgi:hypothetical protein